MDNTLIAKTWVATTTAAGCTVITNTTTTTTSGSNHVISNDDDNNNNNNNNNNNSNNNDDDDDDDGSNDSDKEEQMAIEFAEICDAIRNNDPTITEFHSFFQYPRGYAQQLGDALMHNTRVKVLKLDLSYYLLEPNDDDGVDYDDITDERLVRSLLHYLRTSKVLREVDITQGTEGYVRLVIQALAESAYLEKFTLSLGDDDEPPSVAADVAHLIRSTSSLQELEIPWTNDDHRIASAFVENHSIRVLKLDCWYPEIDIQGHFFSNYVAHAQSPSLLTELTVEFFYPKISSLQLNTALCDFVKTAALSLQKLHVLFMTFDASRMDMFLNSIRDHPTLRKLVLQTCCYNDAATKLFIAFWQNLHTTNTSIESSSMSLTIIGGVRIPHHDHLAGPMTLGPQESIGWAPNPILVTFWSHFGRGGVLPKYEDNK